MRERFMHAVNVLGGLETATPKKILEIMAVPDLKMAQVASHLQRQRRQGLAAGPRASLPPSLPTADHLPDDPGLHHHHPPAPSRQPSARSAKRNMHPDYAYDDDDVDYRFT